LLLYQSIRKCTISYFKHFIEFFLANKNIESINNHNSKCIEQVAEETFTHLIDIRSKVLNVDDYTFVLGEDGVHPSLEGYEIIERTVTEYIRDMIDHILPPMNSYHQC